MNLADYKLPRGHRLLALSHSEIDLIQQALAVAYFDKMKTVGALRRELEYDAANIVREKADTYGDLGAMIENGEKDV